MPISGSDPKINTSVVTIPSVHCFQNTSSVLGPIIYADGMNFLNVHRNIVTLFYSKIPIR